MGALTWAAASVELGGVIDADFALLVGDVCEHIQIGHSVGNTNGRQHTDSR